MGYTKTAIKGITWVSGIRIFTRAISFLRTVIIARVLSPSQFGVFGITTIVLSLTELITETGINVFLIQEEEKIEKFISTAWIVSIIRGLIISCIIIVSAPFVASFFNSQESLNLILLASIIPILRGFINPAVITFQKELNFSKEFLYRSSVFFVESVASIIIVLILQNPTGLVLGLIVGAIYEVIFSFVYLPIRPQLAFTFDHVRHIVSQGKWVTAAGVFNYLFHNVDNLVIGKLLGTASLGLYDMAYKISMVPISEVTDVISRVTFPLYVKIGGDKKRLETAYLKTLALIFIITAPIGIVLFFFPELVIQIVLGEKWLSVAPVFKLLALFGVIRALSNSSSAVFMALKMQKISGMLSFLSFVIISILIIPFVLSWGLVGASYAVFLSTIMIVPLVVYYLRKIFTS